MAQRGREVLFTAMAKGADRVIHILDEGEQDASHSRIAEILSRVSKDVEPSLVLTGIQSEDIGSGQVGILLAMRLGITHSSSVLLGGSNPNKFTIQMADLYGRNGQPLPNRVRHWLLVLLSLFSCVGFSYARGLAEELVFSRYH